MQVQTGMEMNVRWFGEVRSSVYTLGTRTKAPPTLRLPLLCVIPSTFLQQPVFSLSSLFRCLERLEERQEGGRTQPQGAEAKQEKGRALKQIAQEGGEA